MKKGLRGLGSLEVVVMTGQIEWIDIFLHPSDCEEVFLFLSFSSLCCAPGIDDLVG